GLQSRPGQRSLGTGHRPGRSSDDHARALMGARCNRPDRRRWCRSRDRWV
ncbi:MAG: hypothetical protein AVDCRST_MAG70-1627, partial [uncultured Thermomicrobiales bacterium]